MAIAVPCHHEALWRYPSEEHGCTITARRCASSPRASLPRTDTRHGAGRYPERVRLTLRHSRCGGPLTHEEGEV
jgi:hypothetical protein